MYSTIGWPRGGGFFGFPSWLFVEKKKKKERRGGRGTRRCREEVVVLEKLEEKEEKRSPLLVSLRFVATTFFLCERRRCPANFRPSIDLDYQQDRIRISRPLTKSRRGCRQRSGPRWQRASEFRWILPRCNVAAVQVGCSFFLSRAETFKNFFKLPYPIPFSFHLYPVARILEFALTSCRDK